MHWNETRNPTGDAGRRRRGLAKVAIMITEGAVVTYISTDGRGISGQTALIGRGCLGDGMALMGVASLYSCTSWLRHLPRLGLGRGRGRGRG